MTDPTQQASRSERTRLFIGYTLAVIVIVLALAAGFTLLLGRKLFSRKVDDRKRLVGTYEAVGYDAGRFVNADTLELRTDGTLVEVCTLSRPMPNGKKVLKVEGHWSFDRAPGSGARVLVLEHVLARAGWEQTSFPNEQTASVGTWATEYRGRVELEGLGYRKVK